MTNPNGWRVAVSDAANLALLAVFLYALLHPSVLNPFLVEPYTAWTIHCYAFAIPILVINRLLKRRIFDFTVFEYLVCAYVGCVLATWPTSFDRQLTANAITTLVGQLAVFAAVRVLAQHQPTLARVVIAALIAGIAVLEWAAADTHLRIGLSTRLIDFPPLEWNGREGLGLAAAIEFGLLVGLWQQARSSRLQGAALLLIIAVVVELLFLYSRMAWSSAAAVLVAALITSIQRGRFRRYAFALVTVGALVAAVGSPYMMRLAKAAAGLDQAADITISPLSFRVAAWLEAARVMRGHVLAGSGLGTFSAFRMSLNLPPSPYLSPGLPEPMHPHNTYLQQIAETGIFGGLAYLAIWIVALWAGWQISKRDGPGSETNTSLFFALVAIVVANLSENMFEGTERIRLQTIAWMVAALVVTTWHRRSDPSQIALDA
jgi:O-antigen ligase/polysaccharide polymerase Wzy-like membrane protein